MSGHSKWHSIKHKKAAKDVKRGKLFGKLVKTIEIAAREGGGDPTGNASLGTAIQKAKDASVPADNIDRAIKRGTGDLEGVTYEELWYEGYAPGGVALYVQCLTDNRNRAASDVRSTFTRNGGSLGEPGSVAYLFNQKGYLLVAGAEDDVMLAALEGGAEDVSASGDQWEIVTEPADLPAVRSALEEAGIEIESADVSWLPSVTIPVDASAAHKVLRLVDVLDDLDDVQEVYGNFDISDEVMAEVL